MYLPEVASILKNAAARCGLQRVRFKEPFPSSMDNITVMTSFGDIRSTVISSSLLMKRYREESKGSKYFIACSWPGFDGLFPYADEYWAVTPGMMKNLYSSTKGMHNDSPAAVGIFRNLTRWFDDVVGSEELIPFYDNGITQKFFDRFRNIKCFKPAISSSVILGNEFNRELVKRPGKKVFIYPSIQIDTWKKSQPGHQSISFEFWKALISRLLVEKYVPVIYHHPLCHDLSGDFTNECVYVSDPNVMSVLSAMRACDCVLDVFSGISKLATVARVPYLCCDERARYAGAKEFEFDDLCAFEVPKKYIFSFPTIIGSGDDITWKHNLLDSIVSNLEIMTDTDRNLWPPTSELDQVVPYNKVRKSKSKKFGTRFIHIPFI